MNIPPPRPGRRQVWPFATLTEESSPHIVPIKEGESPRAVQRRARSAVERYRKKHPGWNAATRIIGSNVCIYRK